MKGNTLRRCLILTDSRQTSLLFPLDAIRFVFASVLDEVSAVTADSLRDVTPVLSDALLGRKKHAEGTEEDVSGWVCFSPPWKMFLQEYPHILPPLPMNQRANADTLAC